MTTDAGGTKTGPAPPVTTAAKVRHGLISAAVFGTCLAVTLWLGNRTAPQRRKPPGGGATLVQTVAVQEGDGRLDVLTRGVVVPAREVRVPAEVGGRVVFKSPSARAGHLVSAGQELMRIERHDYELAVERLERELAARRSELATLKVQQQGAERLLELANRDISMAERDQTRVKNLQRMNAGTESAADAAERAVLTAQTQAAQLRNQRDEFVVREKLLAEQIRLAETDLKGARRDLERTVITAPMDGVVVTDVVEESDFAAAGSTVLTIEDVSAAEVRCDLTYEELLLLRQHDGRTGDSRDLRPDARPAVTLPRVPAVVQLSRGGQLYRWEGRLDGQEGVGLDETTRTITCRITVDDPLGTAAGNAETPSGRPPLLRGLFVDVRLQSRPNLAMLRVPLTAVRPGGRLWLNRDGVLAVANVDVLSVDEEVAILSGDGEVRGGDRVIVSPLTRVVAGMPLSEVGTPDDAVDGDAAETTAAGDSSESLILGRG